MQDPKSNPEVKGVVAVESAKVDTKASDPDGNKATIPAVAPAEAKPETKQV